VQDESEGEAVSPGDCGDVADLEESADDSILQSSCGDETVNPTPRADKSENKKKKKGGCGTNVKSDLRPFEKIANTATQMLATIANKKSDTAASNVGKDWDFCKHMYNKLMEIPDGDIKDELQLVIQGMIIRAKRQCASTDGNATNSVACQPYHNSVGYPNSWNSTGQPDWNTSALQQSSYGNNSGSFCEMLTWADLGN